jgi:hypothetical protein
MEFVMIDKSAIVFPRWVLIFSETPRWGSVVRRWTNMNSWRIEQRGSRHLFIAFVLGRAVLLALLVTSGDVWPR